MNEEPTEVKSLAQLRDSDDLPAQDDHLAPSDLDAEDEAGPTVRLDVSKAATSNKHPTLHDLHSEQVGDIDEDSAEEPTNSVAADIDEPDEATVALSTEQILGRDRDDTEGLVADVTKSIAEPREDSPPAAARRYPPPQDTTSPGSLLDMPVRTRPQPVVERARNDTAPIDPPSPRTKPPQDDGGGVTRTFFHQAQERPDHDEAGRARADSLLDRIGTPADEGSSTPADEGSSTPADEVVERTAPRPRPSRPMPATKPVKRAPWRAAILLSILAGLMLLLTVTYVANRQS